ncbi:bifunctional DNA primase/polymerase [Streptomyces sp. PT12]|uniref:bifunctional DNA primase/polymerase n=1 Tax=Streptomyces sp. PT12 TaxID=1510197 RepID=UPI000DE2CD4B|nr:bifunctional DNA primase/polymerase [Streptomyces sp. PT12]RBM05650.1 DNA primase [Streptomyces sp. PT12]
MTPDARAALLNAALQAASRGWPVFPLRPGDKRPAGHADRRCPRTGRCSNGHLTPEQRATTDPGLIRACWQRPNGRAYNVGIATGPAGLVVIDLDKPKNKGENDSPDGETTFKALCERTGHPVPATRRIRTPSGGTHLYFTAPPDTRLRNTAGRLGQLIDTRAWGGYVVAPGSTIDGEVYEVTDPAPVAPLPAWLADLLETPPLPPIALAKPIQNDGPGKVRNLTAYVQAALDNETAAVATAPEGTRNWTLTRAARALGRLIASGDLPRRVVEEALKGAGRQCGLPERDCTATITNALNWSIANNPTGRTS